MQAKAGFAISLLIFCTIGSAADVANMSGVWKLNLKKSKFQKNEAPLSVELKIEHSEPTLKYSGSVVGSQESQPDTFEFQGAIDEKIYPVKQNKETGRTIKFARQSPRTIESWSSDNSMEEHAVTTLSSNGKTMTRKMHVKLKNGTTREWIEVYEKQG